ncbi:15776_t:CDS:2, partial [Acaulospora colombiana]
EDLSGNEYYEAVRVINGRKKRTVEMKEERPLCEYDSDEVPVQWQSWLRHTRFDPPTIEELISANKRKEMIIQRAKALDKEWEERKSAMSRGEVISPRPVETIGEEVKDFPFGTSTIPSGSFNPESWNPASTKK